jgi:TctA family transporter
VTTRVVGFGVSLLSLSYLVGGLRIPLSEGPLLDGVEAYSALVGVLVVRGALMQASPASPRAPKKTVPGSLKRTEGGEPGFF